LKCKNQISKNKLFAFGCWLLALLKTKAKGERLIANGFTSFYMSFYFLLFNISFSEKLDQSFGHVWCML